MQRILKLGVLLILLFAITSCKDDKPPVITPPPTPPVVNPPIVPSKAKYDVTFVCNGGLEVKGYIDVEEGTVITLPITEKANYTFGGWYEDDSCIGFKVENTITVNRDYTLYARFDEIADRGYTLSFDTGEAEPLASIENIMENSVIRLPHPTRPGYSFYAWYTDAAFSKDARVDYTITMTKDTTLYAYWWPENSTITFVTNSSVVVPSITQETDSQLVLPVPKREHYLFMGWYYNGEEFSNNKMPAENITLLAKWTPLSKHITYNLSGGEFADSDTVVIDVPNNTMIELPRAVKAGYVFLHWYDNDNNIYKNTLEVTNDLILYAQYDEIASYQKNYSLTLNLQGGTLLAPLTSYETGVTTTLPIPTKANSIFLGWYTNSVGSGKKYINITNSDFGNKTYYAVWANKNAEFTVNFVSYDDVTVLATQTLKYGEILANVNTPINGELAYSWYLGNDIYDFTQPVTSNMTLVARWTILSEILDSILPEETFDNIDLATNVLLDNKFINIEWISSDYMTLNSIGIVNPGLVDINVYMKAVFSYNGITCSHEFPIKIKKLIMPELSSIKTPVFAYIYSGMAAFKQFSDKTMETVNVMNYGFARVLETGNVSIGELLKLSEVLQVRKKGIRVVMCFGGYGEAGINFSNCASTEAGRIKLAKSIVDAVVLYHFDGVDIDWEYPGFKTGRDVATDRVNYTLLMKEIHQRLKAVNSDYLLTAALPGGSSGSHSRYELDKLGDYLDYIHLMTYDLNSGGRATHHTAFDSSAYTPYGCVKESVQAYIASGFPKEKLVVGIAFYGKIYMANNTISLGTSAYNPEKDTITYTEIKRKYLNNAATDDGIYLGWDASAQAPYIISRSENIFITYDNVRSVTLKTDYAKANGLGGVMYWDHGSDISGDLISAIYDELH